MSKDPSLENYSFIHTNRPKKKLFPYFSKLRLCGAACLLTHMHKLYNRQHLMPNDKILNGQHELLNFVHQPGRCSQAAKCLQLTFITRQAQPVRT